MDMTQEEFERVHVPNLTDEPCDCPDALAFRAFMSSPAGEAADALADILAVRKLREMSHDLSGAADWSRPGPTFETLEQRRARYVTPALTAEEINERVRASWTDMP